MSYNRVELYLTGLCSVLFKHSCNIRGHIRQLQGDGPAFVPELKETGVQAHGVELLLGF